METRQMIRILKIYVCLCVFFRQKRFRLTASMVGKRIKNGQNMYLNILLYRVPSRWSIHSKVIPPIRKTYLQKKNIHNGFT
jgi:hypothetical protein